jgi:uncharacterized membrane protein YhaH (DUF805 family)
MEWMLMPLKRYAQFNGRARPKEFWMFVLFLILGTAVAMIVDAALGLGGATRYVDQGTFYYGAGFASSGGVVTLLFALGTFIPYLAVAVRRLHDTDRSGWWLLLALLPLIGGIVLFVFMVMGGTRGPNRFGPDPVEAGAATG